MAAAIILWISVAIGCGYALRMGGSAKVLLPLGVVLLSSAVVFAILQRKLWARRLLLAVTFVGAAALAASLIVNPFSQATATAYAVRGIQSVLRFSAVYLLFTDPARSWFGGRRI
ncbi:MAG TPA: hypothetical protein VGD63_07580 [Steroidobacteraceae bacterium]